MKKKIIITSILLLFFIAIFYVLPYFILGNYNNINTALWRCSLMLSPHDKQVCYFYLAGDTSDYGMCENKIKDEKMRNDCFARLITFDYDLLYTGKAEAKCDLIKNNDKQRNQCIEITNTLYNRHKQEEIDK